MKTSTFVSGVGLGVVAGAALTAAMLPVNARMMRKSVPVRAVKTMGKMIDRMS